jgi:hypothetical protein
MLIFGGWFIALWSMASAFIMKIILRWSIKCNMENVRIVIIKWLEYDENGKKRHWTNR